MYESDLKGKIKNIHSHPVLKKEIEEEKKID